MGNLLIFFPAAYYFATFTGREIIIQDNSIIGEMCNIITCGFPFVSDLAKAFPKILTPSAVANAREMKANDFQRHMEKIAVVNDAVVRGSGFMSKSDWWSYFNESVHCVSRITGCDLGDVPCADRHAYQRLIRGPFRSSLTIKEEERISGIPNHTKHAILTLPHAYAPRLDLAIHIRAQFEHFEASTDINDPEYRKEVSTWLNGSECAEVFRDIESKTLELATQSAGVNTSVANWTRIEPFYIYLASDNEEVKDALSARLSRFMDSAYQLRIMKVDSKFIHHVKHFDKLKQATNGEGILDLVFDWYALTLSNVILGWRKGGTNFVSTFVHSAQRVSGTTDRTNIHAPLGQGGIGSKGFQLTKHRNHYRFDHMWIYNFLEDYAKPGDR
jgi:hypothetical protein